VLPSPPTPPLHLVLNEILVTLKNMDKKNGSDGRKDGYDHQENLRKELKICDKCY